MQIGWDLKLFIVVFRLEVCLVASRTLRCCRRMADWINMWDAGNIPWHNDKVARLVVFCVVIILT